MGKDVEQEKVEEEDLWFKLLIKGVGKYTMFRESNNYIYLYHI